MKTRIEVIEVSKGDKVFWSPPDEGPPVKATVVAAKPDIVGCVIVRLERASRLPVRPFVDRLGWHALLSELQPL